MSGIPPGGDPMAGGPPPPNIAQIPLPPGMTLPQFFELQQALIRISICVAVGFALVLYDYFVLLRDELSLYSGWDKIRGQSPAFYAFIILRYAGILAVFPALFFTSVESQACQAAASVSQVGVVLVTGSAGIIFCYRVFAIWQGNKFVTGLISIFYLFMIGSWIATATGLRALTGPSPPFGSNCIMQPVPTWSPLGFASSVAFDTLILILGLIKLRGNLMTSSRVTRQIYQDNIMYFTIVTVTNIVVLAIQSLPAEHDLIKPTALPFSSVVTYAMGARVFLNLRLFNQREARAEQGLPLTSKFSGSNSQNTGLTSGTRGFPATTARTTTSHGYTTSIGSEPKPSFLAQDDEDRASVATATPEPRLQPLRHPNAW